MNEKSDSKWISLATASILGQPPADIFSSRNSKFRQSFATLQYFFRPSIRLIHPHI
ncbi:MAG: hypothetical protein V3V31_07355 [Methylococcales bacterium]